MAARVGAAGSRRLQLFALLGAVLLFGLEPLVGRLILPAYGGAFDVWATCLMFFQGSLFAGYLYCHVLAPRLGRWHLLVMTAPLLLLPLAGAPPPPDPEAPVTSLLGHLGAWVFLPFGVLATTGVVAQRWLAGSGAAGAGDPYHLYAASNAGSLLGLLAYPLVVEPVLALDTQRYAWSVAYVGYLGLALWAAPLRRRARPGADGEAAPAEAAAGAGVAPETAEEAAPPEATAPPEAAAPPAAAGDPGGADGAAGPYGRPTARRVVYWFLLSMAPSAFLVAVTNAIALDLGSMPLVWVLPLSLYLGSFVLVFGRRPWYPGVLRRFWPDLVVVALWFHATSDRGVDLWSGLLHLATLFAVCMAGHSALHRARPRARHLTTFYLVVSLGGWAGGVFVSLVAPRLFSSLAEYPLALLLLCGTLLVGRRRELLAWLREAPRALLLAKLLFVSAVAADTLERTLFPRGAQFQPQTVAVRRNFYGVYTVTQTPSSEPGLSLPERRRRAVRRLHHGTTLHGKQLVHHPRARRQPIGYYHPRSPLGDVLRLAPRPRRAGVIGLGAGAAAAYFERGEAVTFYELDPGVVRIARRHFTYLDDCPADVRVVTGDARLALRRDEAVPDGGYDVILVDAFSSDAIPTHLLTREALELYEERLAPQGYLVFHISNRFYDLRPVLRATSRGFLHGAYRGRSEAQVERNDDFEDASQYYVLRRPEDPLEPLLEAGWTAAADGDLPELAPWTDDYANVLAPLAARWWPELVE